MREKRQFRSGDKVLRRNEADGGNTGEITWFSKDHRFASVYWRGQSSPVQEEIKNLVSPQEWREWRMLRV